MTPTPPPGPAKPKLFNCPSCGAQIALRGMGKTVAAACGSCAAVIDVSNESYRIIQAAQTAQKIKPAIALGTRGRLRGELWEVIGFMRRSDQSGAYYWHEYLLFNPYQGFRWLVEYQGHWSYVITLRNKPVATGRLEVTHLGKSFAHFLTGSAHVRYVEGEFYWRVQVGDQAYVEDYVLPPEMLSMEREGSEIIWSLGEYTEPDAIRAAFNVPAERLPAPTGVAPNQPSEAASTNRELWTQFAQFLSVITVLSTIFLVTAKNESVHTGAYQFQPGSGEQVIVTSAFELPRWSTNLVIKAQSPVDNSWVFLGYSLVNSETGETWESGSEISYYHGYDSDGSWTEGSQKDEAWLSAVPAGRYVLRIHPEQGAGDNTPKSISIDVRRDQFSLMNVLAAALTLAFFPIVAFFRSRSFEKERWSESDHPMTSGSDDDDD